MTKASRRARVALLAISTALCSGLAAPAGAQSYRNLDANGVDLTLGDFVMAFNEGSIGNGKSELSLIRHDGSQRASQWELITFSRTVSGSTATIRIGREGSYVDSFSGTSTATSFSPAKADGSTLTKSGNVYTYATREGATITFADPTGGTGSQSNFCNDAYLQTTCYLLPTQMAVPTGAMITLAWNVTSGGGSPIAYSSALASVTNSFGYAITFNYDGSGNRTGATFSRGGIAQGSVSYNYPVAGTTNLTALDGNVWVITSTSITDPRGSVALSVSGTTGVTSATNAGVTTNYSRTVSGSTATMVATDALAETTTVVSNLGIGRPTSLTDGRGKTTSFGYDANGRLTSVTEPEGNSVTYTLDGRGNRTQSRFAAKPGSGAADILTSASFDTACASQAKCNQPNSITDGRGNTTDYTYDSTTGAALTVTESAPTIGVARPQTRYSYTAVSGDKLLTGTSACVTGSSCIGTSDEVVSSLAYDSYGNPTSVTAGAGNAGGLTATTMMTYTGMGDVATVDGPLTGADDTTYYRYDGARRLVGTIYPDPDGFGSLKRRAVKQNYLINGAAGAIFIGTVNGTTDTDWAAFSASYQQVPTIPAWEPTVQKLVAGTTSYALTQYTYDDLGRPQCTAVRMNDAKWLPINLPASACTLGTAGNYGQDRITKLSYDAAGNVVKRQTAYGTADQADDETATYTDNGQLATLTDGEGNKTTYEYDGFDRLLKTRYPSATKGAGTSSTTDYEQLTYDADGNVTTRRLRDGTSITYSYDNLDRLVTKDLPGSELDVTYSYDLLDRMTGASTSAQTLAFTYDALGRTLTQTSLLGTVSSQYDLAGHRTRLTWPDGFYVTYEYRITGEIAAIKESGTTILATYAYDDLGRRVSLTRGNGVTTSYSYDPVSRLSSLASDLAGTASDLTLGFSYNPASQITSTTRSNIAYSWTGAANAARNYTTNGLNQYSANTGTSFGYDTRGNLTNSGSSTYTYSSENLLLSGPGSASLSYDPLARLYQSGSTAIAASKYLYDGDQPIALYVSSTGSIESRYVPGADGQLLLEYSVAGARQYAISDERGSVIDEADASGNSLGAATYDEYGIPGSGNNRRVQYTGQIWLPEIGMYYYRARLYSPTLGRFMQTDPIGYADSMNWYNYVGSDPVNQTDPTGLEIVITGIRTCIDFGTCGSSRGLLGNIMPLSILRRRDGGDRPDDIVVTATRRRSLAPRFGTNRQPLYTKEDVCRALAFGQDLTSGIGLTGVFTGGGGVKAVLSRMAGKVAEDAIPGVGELLGTAQIAATVGWGIFTVAKWAGGCN